MMNSNVMTSTLKAFNGAYLTRTESPALGNRFAPDVRQRIKQQSFELMAIQPGHHVLDVGCGSGEDVRALADWVGPNGRVVGVDSNPKMIDAARRRYQEARLPVLFQVERVNKLPFWDDMFHSCRADHLFTHLRDRKSALREMIHVVKPGGRVVVTEPDWGGLIIDAPETNLTRRILEFRGRMAINGWSGRQLPSLFHQVGLTDVQIVPASLVVTRYQEANELFQIETAVDHMQAARLLDKERGQRWLDYLRAAEAAGSFFSAITIFTVCGRKP